MLVGNVIISVWKQNSQETENKQTPLWHDVHGI